MKTKYVLGFAFSDDGQYVVVIKKNRPEWQAGMFNGIGGHIDENENPFKAMIREFEEETGYLHKDWYRFAKMEGKDFEVHCFKMFSKYIFGCETKTDEEISILPVKEVLALDNIITNLKWLIPLALDNQPELSIIKY